MPKDSILRGYIESNPWRDMHGEPLAAPKGVYMPSPIIPEVHQPKVFNVSDIVSGKLEDERWFPKTMHGEPLAPLKGVYMTSPIILEVHQPKVFNVSDIVSGKLEDERWFPKTMRVGLVGKMHSGKSTVSDVFRQENWDYSAFADTVKDIAVHMVNTETIIVMQHLGQPWTPLTRADLDANKDKYRSLLQFVGDYGRKTYGDDVWIKIWDRKYSAGYFNPTKKVASGIQHGAGIFVDDVRFRNEGMFLKNKGFTLIKVERDEKDRRNSVSLKFEEVHGREPKKRELKELLTAPSETEVDDVPVDIIIRNDSTVDELRRVAGRMIGKRDYTHLLKTTGRKPFPWEEV